MFPTEDSIQYMEAARDMVPKRYLGVAAGMILAWDWVTHLDDEVRFIWLWGWTSVAKPLYLILRYVGLAANIYDAAIVLGAWSAKACTGYLYTTSINTAFSLYLVDIMLAYRVACLYPNQYRWLGPLNWVLLTCAAIGSVVMFATNFTHVGTIDTPEHLTGCWSERSPFSHNLIGPPLAFELWIFLLVLYKLYLTWRERHTLGAQTTYRLVIEDQIYWFFLINIVIIWSSIHFVLASRTLRAFPFLYLRTLASICGCRLIIHIRKSYLSMSEPYDPTLATVLFRRPTLATLGQTLDEGKTQVPALESESIRVGRDYTISPDTPVPATREGDAIEMTSFKVTAEDLEMARNLHTNCYNGG